MSVIDAIRDAYLSPPLPPTNAPPEIGELMPIEDARRHAAAWILALLPAAVIIAVAPGPDLHPVLALTAVASMLAGFNTLFWVPYYLHIRRLYRRTDAYRAD